MSRILDSIKRRLPIRSEAILSFGWCVFLVHVWAIINVLVVLPSWALRLGLFELAGVAAYPLAFALFESLLVWVLVLMLSFLLPGKLLREDFVTQSAVFIFIIAVVSAILHYSVELVFQYQFLIIILLFFTFLLALVMSYLSGKSSRLKVVIPSIISRITLLSAIYIIFDLVGVLIILARNFVL